VVADRLPAFDLETTRFPVADFKGGIDDNVAFFKLRLADFKGNAQGIGTGPLDRPVGLIRYFNSGACIQSQTAA